ncbi:Restriction modification system DNA specificity domain [Acetoanaerobium sticklandii]|uniref:Restriction modification system DNA specificity domain n=2 Tax=Acetoanaerobium sticklandii TaxID=1511 RepID=E3PY69_ACESD|nr:Restriction modification system DNA specificity domain [Acetoanaerobium sticklandii]
MREMKDSELLWLGEYNETWDLVPLKHLVNITTGKKDVNQGHPDGEYPFFTCSMTPYRSSNYSFDSEALLVAGNGMVGFTQYYNGKFEAYQRTYVLSDFKEIHPLYLKHYITELLPKYLTDKSVGSVIDFIKLGDLKSFGIVRPSITDQKKISSYLEQKVALIDNILEKTKQSIEEYKKYKQSLITETVTKGLNPDVKMKDIGIEWIGEIPEQWKVLKLKCIFEISKRISGELGHSVLSVTQNGLKIKDLTSNEGQLSSDYSKYQYVYKTDFVMNHMDLLTGWVDLSPYDGVTSPDYRVFKMKDGLKYSKEYYLYIFQVCYLNQIFYGLGQGISNLGRWRLQTDKFINFSLPVPPIDEQKKIAKFLQNKLGEIEKFVKTKESLLKELEAYKKSLIYEVVTGKKEII